MSSETDHPRQRTVAELLAEHGDAGVTGRRRRRREADEPEAAEQAPVGATPESAAYRPGPDGPTRWHQDGPDRSVQRQPAPSETRPQPLSQPAPPMPLPGARTPPPFAPGPMPVSSSSPASAPPSISAKATPPATPVREAGARRSGSGRMPGWEPRDRTSTTSAAARENGRVDNGGPGGDGATTQSLTGLDRSAEQLPRFGPARGATARPVDPARSPDLPRLPEAPRGAGALDPGLTGPIQHRRPPLRVSGAGSGPEDPDAGPAPTVGTAPVGAESWHRARPAAREAPARDATGDTAAHDTSGRDVVGRDTAARGRTGRDAGRAATGWDTIGGVRRDVVDDGGPETQAGPLDLDDFEDAGFDDSYDGERGTDLPGSRTVGGRKRTRDDDFDYPAGLHPDEEDAGPRRRLGRAAAEAAASPGQAWMAVLAQWIVGALGGAALWVGFRFLWRSLPVVALAAAVLVTIGLVVIVRALLHNDDRRTTVFAVLVGLLLTISPAILVLLDR